MTKGGPYATQKVPEAQTEIKKFQALTGRLLFIPRRWRPDIRYALQRLFVKTRAPISQDWVNGLNVVAYLLSTEEKGTVLGPLGQEPVDIFTDAGEEKLQDWVTNGILTRLGRLPV